MRRTLPITIGFLCWALSSPSLAIEPNECVKLHSQAQDAKQAGKLLSARQGFLECANESCPAMIREECARLLGGVESSIATFVFEATGPDGRPTKDVEVSVDGKIVTDRLRATATPVDPGEHVFRFRHRSGKVVEQTVTVLEGQKNRLLSLSFSETEALPEPEPEPKQAAPKRGIPAGTWIFAGVGVAALGSFSYFALSGKKKESDLDACKPDCSDSQYDKMSRDYLIADISLGVAVVAGGVATFIALGSGSSSKEVGFRPARGGGTASFRARF